MLINKKLVSDNHGIQIETEIEKDNNKGSDHVIFIWVMSIKFKKPKT